MDFYFGIGTIIATLLGPILAVQAQKMIERINEQRERRLNIFRTLMATRTQTLSQEHVAALNAVPIEFYGRGKKLRNIVEKWKEHLDHLGTDANQEIWSIKSRDLFNEMIFSMSNYLGYPLTKLEISKDIYYPRGHITIEQEQTQIRQGLARLLTGQSPLPIEILSVSSDEKITSAQVDMLALLNRWLAGDSSVIVSLREEKS